MNFHVLSLLPLSIKVLLLVYASCGFAAVKIEPETLRLTPEELTDIAIQYEHGEGVEQNIDKAIQYYCLAASKDYARAQYGLGWIYANGRSGIRNDAIAWQWFNKAAKHGDKNAEKLLKFVVSDKNIKEARCILSDGTEFFEPLKSIPNPSPEVIHKWVARLSPEYNLEPTLVLAVIKAESNFNVKALSPKNAQGLMQLIPDTAKRFNVKDVWDPLENLKGGMAYLQWLMIHFQGDLELVLAGYNAGERAVERHEGVPPYKETRAYISFIFRTLENEHLVLPGSI